MLSYNNFDNTFFLISNDEEKARKAGLTLSTKSKYKNGDLIWFTSDFSRKPTFNPYAVLNFYNEADDKAKEHLQCLKNSYDASRAKNSAIRIPIPNGLEYLPYQKAGIAYALDHGNCLIGDEPGLGKTIQAVGIANATGAKRVLVVCPASIRLNWQREIMKWSTIPRVTTYPILKGSDGVNPYSNYVIISYDLARNKDIHAALYTLDYDMIILDEAHYLKTTDAIRTRSIFGGGKGDFEHRHLAQKTNRIVALTGTPLPNRPRECYMIARGLNWEAIDYMSYDLFSFRYNPSARMDSDTVIEKKGRLPELQARLRCNFMVRRLKADVLKDLPDKRYEMSYVQSNGAIDKVLAKEKLLDFDPDSLLLNDFKIDGAIATVRREMGEAMVPRVIEHVKYLFDVVELHKIILFAHHKNVMNSLTEQLGKYGIVKSRGGMSTFAKQESVDDFIADKKIKIFLAQLDTMEGVDGLQDAADYAVFAEPAWTPGRNEQCVDRLHRIGQHKNVVAQFLLVENSFNEKVLKAVLHKVQIIHMALDAI